MTDRPVKATRISRRNVITTTNEASMTTRKPKPTFSPLIEWPTEQLQWMPITVEHKAPAPAGKTQWAGGAAIDGAQPLEEPLASHVELKGAWRRRMN
jgi:hypothetical protein